MSMTYHIDDRDSLLNNFLIPISKIVDSVVLNVTPGSLKALIATGDNTIIVQAEYKDSTNNLTAKLNIPDIKKLCRTLQCIEAKSFDLVIDSNSITYTSPTVRFKYHLYEDNIISVPKLSLSKVEQLEFDGKFTISNTAISNLVKGSSIATDTNKIYLSVQDNILFGELTDKARSNTDSFGIQISTDYKGQAINKSIPLNFEIFRIISSMRYNTILGQIVTSMGVLTFDMLTENTKLKFVVSALLN